MGSMSKESRCQRFIDEFQKDYTKKLTPSFNDAFVSSGLGTHESFLVVMFYLRLKDADGNEHELTYGDIIYDPDEPNEDLVDRICVALLDVDELEEEFENKNLKRKGFTERLKKVGLVE